MSKKKQQNANHSFRSSVNCIPVLRPLSRKMPLRTQKDSPERQPKHFSLPEHISDFLRDSPPTSLDHLGGDTYSGTLRLTVEAMTALVFGNQVKHAGRPTEISIPVDPTTGHPFIPPTMIKGMISNAYERLTSSRFRVFGDHSVALTYRADPAAAIGLVPMRLSDEYDQGTHTGTLLYGPNKTPYAKLLTHEAKKKEENKRETKRPLLAGSSVWAILHHGELVKFKAKKIGDSYIVTQVSTIDKEDYSQLNVPDWVSNSESNEESFTGWFYSTTPHDQLTAGKTIFSSKLSERIFFCDKTNNIDISIAPEVAATYDRIIRSYSYDSTDPTSKVPSAPSRFVIDRAGNEDIDPINHSGLLTYARLQDNRVVELMPTQVGRRNYSQSPQSLASKQGILPVSHPSEASPADRIFGFIPSEVQKTSIQPNERTGALRGKITISAVDTSSVTLKNEKLDLRPLLAPKTTSARRFLTNATGSTISGCPRPYYYSPGDLLGAASYPFRRRDADRHKSGDGRLSYATLKSYEKEVEQEKSSSGGQTNKDVYSTARTWIPRGSTFHCTLHFEGLARDELRMLLWVLDSQLLGKYAQYTDSQQNPEGSPDSSTIEGYLRLGMGKPLGLGVVQVTHTPLEIVHTSCSAGADVLGLVDDYESLEGCLGAASPYAFDLSEDWSTGFLQEAADFYEALSATPWCKAFLRSCTGYPGKVEVRYMKLGENKRNNKTDKEGSPRNGCALAPRSLADDDWTAALAVPEDA